MNDYRKIQSQFSNMIRKNEISPTLLGEIIPGGKLDFAESLKVYQNGYIVRMTESLGETFEAIWRFLGDDDFFKICEEYIQENFSQSYNISEYGNSFPEFLSRKYPSLPFLEELAEFELMFRDLFHQKYEIFTPDFSRISSPDIVLQFNNNSRILKFNSPVYTFWKNRNEENFSLASIDLTENEYIIIYKSIKTSTKNHVIHVKRLSLPEFKLMEELARGQRMATALESIEEASITEEQIRDLFYFIKDSGIIAEIKA